MHFSAMQRLAAGNRFRRSLFDFRLPILRRLAATAAMLSDSFTRNSLHRDFKAAVGVRRNRRQHRNLINQCRPYRHRQLRLPCHAAPRASLVPTNRLMFFNADRNFTPSASGCLAAAPSQIHRIPGKIICDPGNSAAAKKKRGTRKESPGTCCFIARIRCPPTIRDVFPVRSTSAPKSPIAISP